MSAQKQYLTVTQLNYMLKKTITDTYPVINFEGEISSLLIAASGHAYLDVKDENSVIRCIIWKGKLSQVKFRPKDGMKVLCQGSPDIYPQRGQLQVQITNMIQAGEGDLMLKFTELKEKLSKEGLFDLDRKRTIPYFPKSIGIITSASGAVIHDMSVKIEERMPSTKVYLYSANVQGKGASKEIANGIEYFNKKANVEVLIVARGGGSLEDLWAFNEEELVRAIFASKIPVISGVGHEPDVTLSDLVADVRAPTPTAAAEIVVPKRSDLLDQINKIQKRLGNFESWFNSYYQEVDSLEEDFSNSFEQYLKAKQEKLFNISRLLKLIKPSAIIDNSIDRVKSLESRLLTASKQNTNRLIVKMESLTRRLESVNPSNVLNRGYTIVRKENKVIVDPKKLKLRDEFKVEFANGVVKGIVDK